MRASAKGIEYPSSPGRSNQAAGGAGRAIAGGICASKLAQPI